MSRSIKKIHRGFEPVDYEAYVYEYTVKPSDKKYVGYHVGIVDDGYHHSSTNSDFNEIFENVDSEIYLKILDYGESDVMKNKEYDILTEVDAANNHMYFNKHNGAPAYPHPNVDKASALYDDITTKGVFPTKIENLKDLYQKLIADGNRIQARHEEDDDMVDWVAEQTKFAGNTDMCEPLRILVDENGKYKLLDGNTTLMGAYKSRKHVTKIECTLIPKKLGTDDDWEDVALLMNPIPDFKKKASSPKDLAKRLYNRYVKYGTKIKCKENRDFLTKMNVKNKSKIYKIAQNWVNKGQIVGTYINYRLEHNAKKLLSRVNQFINSTTYCVSMSSGKFRWEDVLDFCCTQTNYGKKHPKIKNYKIVIQHPNEKDDDQWQLDVGGHHQKIKSVCSKYNIKWLGFDYMDTQENLS